MNRCGPQARESAADGFHPVSRVMVDRGDLGRKCAWGMLLTKRRERHVCCFQSHSFPGIGVIGLSRLHRTPCRSITPHGVERTPITGRTWSQDPLNRLSRFGHHERKFEPIKITCLPGQIAPRPLVLVPRDPGDSSSITDRHGQAIHELY
jgi:hypothetical protein